MKVWGETCPQYLALTAADMDRPGFEGAKFIWTNDLNLDNTVIFRTRIDKPGWTARWNVPVRKSSKW